MAAPKKEESSGTRAPWKPHQIRTNLKTGTTLSKGCGCLSERPKLAEKIASCITCWANTERILCEILAYTLESDPWVAADLVSNVRNFRARLTLVLKYIRKRFGTQFHDWAKERFSLARTLSKERNKLAHGVFFVASQYPDGLIRTDGWGDDEKWYLHTDETLEALFNELVAAQSGAGDVFFAVVELVQRQQCEEGREPFPGQMLLGGVLPHPPPTKSNT